MMWPDLWVQVSNGGFDKTDATWGLITTSTRIITTWLRLLKCADVMILCLIQRKICPNSTMLRQSLQQQRRAKACPPRLSLPHSHCTQALTPLLLLLCPSWQRAYVGAQGVFSGTNGAWGTKKKKKRVWVAFGAQPTVPEQVMCQFCRQRGRVGAHLGRSPVELGLGGEGM